MQRNAKEMNQPDLSQIGYGIRFDVDNLCAIVCCYCMLLLPIAMAHCYCRLLLPIPIAYCQLLVPIVIVYCHRLLLLLVAIADCYGSLLLPIVGANSYCP